MNCEACGNTAPLTHHVTGDTVVQVCPHCQRSLRRHLREHKELMVRQMTLASKVRQSRWPSSSGVIEDHEQLYAEFIEVMSVVDAVVEEWLSDQSEGENND